MINSQNDNCSLIRKIKIHKLIPVLFLRELELILFIKDKLKDLIKYEHKYHLQSIFYMKPDGECILEQDNKYNMLWVKFDGFWDVLNRKRLLYY